MRVLNHRDSSRIQTWAGLVFGQALTPEFSLLNSEYQTLPQFLAIHPIEWIRQHVVIPECVAKGSHLTLGGLGVEPCSRSVASTSATVRNRSQPFATRRCHWGKLLQVTFHGCVTCQFATLFHCDLHENDMSRKKRDALRCTGAAFCEILSLLRSSIGISVWRVVFLGCWMWPCHWDLRFRVWHRSSVFVISLS